MQTVRTPQLRKTAFTLAELLIVIGIMVLMMAVAVPVFNLLTGARSVETAENAIAATLSQTRLSAIAAQAPRGLIFYRDAGTDRIAMARVTYDPATTATEVVAATDQAFLPSGVDIAFRHNTGTGVNDYLYRLPTGDGQNLRGLILFDAKGQFTYRRWGVAVGSELARRATNDNGINTFPNPTDFFYSQPAFLLFDRSAADNASDLKAYINDNAAVLLVNRYNGTLTRSE